MLLKLHEIQMKVCFVGSAISQNAKQRITDFTDDERGGGPILYVLVLLLGIIVVMVLFALFSEQILQWWNEISTRVTDGITAGQDALGQLETIVNE